MISALISFFGGSAFRMVWGELSAWLTARQEHKFELERMKVQADLDKSRHQQDCERLRLQAELHVREIDVQRDADLSRIEGDAWAGIVGSTARTTGIRLIDAWNGAIRPLLATLAIVVMVGEVAHNGFALNDWNRELVGAILGIYIADRSLSKRGK